MICATFVWEELFTNSFALNGNVTNDALIRPNKRNIKWYVIATSWLLHAQCTLIFKSVSHQTLLHWLNWISLFWPDTQTYIQTIIIWKDRLRYFIWICLLFKLFKFIANDNSFFGCASESRMKHRNNVRMHAIWELQASSIAKLNVKRMSTN